MIRSLSIHDIQDDKNDISCEAFIQIFTVKYLCPLCHQQLDVDSGGREC